MKKIIFILVLIFLILLGGVGYYVYINNQSVPANTNSIFNSVRNFLPFGTPSQQITPPTQNNYGTTTPNQNNNQIKIDRMFQISETPTAGFIAIDTISSSTKIVFNTEKNATTSSSTKQTETYVRFVERATGHVIESKMSNLEKTRISNITVPKVYESFLNSKGTEFITKTLSGETISTEYRKVSTSTTPTTEITFSYPSNTDILITKGDSVFYTTKTTTGSVGFLTTFDNKKPVQLFSTPLREINASWSGGNTLEIFSKPHSQYGGISFVVDIKNKTINESLSGIRGLSTNPNMDGTYTLYNTNINDLSLGAKKGKTNIVSQISIKTLPEKCVWSKKNTKVAYCAVPSYFDRSGYPEDWYKGNKSSNDDFWSINVETGEESVIYRPINDGKEAPDAINLSLNEKENYLFFTNKRDLSLWGLAI
jgi:hypothetical protein